MGILDIITGKSGKVASAVSEKISDMGDAVSSVSSTAGNSLVKGMRELEYGAQESLSGGASHKQLMDEMEHREQTKTSQYENGLGL